MTRPLKRRIADGLRESARRLDHGESKSYHSVSSAPKNAVLIDTKTYQPRQIPPNTDFERHGDTTEENTGNFASGNDPQILESDSELLKTPFVPRMFEPEQRFENYDTDDTEDPDTADAPSVTTNDDNSGKSISAGQLNMFLDVCYGKPVATQNKKEILQAIDKLEGTEFRDTAMKAISGSRERIKEYLNQAEQDSYY